MGLKFICTSCGEPIVIRFLKPGDVARCHHCGSFTEVPEAVEVTDEAPVYQPQSSLPKPPQVLIQRSDVFPEPDTPEERTKHAAARRAIRQGGHVGVLMAAITGAMLAAAAISGSPELAYYGGKWQVLDILFDVILSWALYRGSPVAAVLLMASVTGSLPTQPVAVGIVISELALAVFYLFFFLRALRGALRLSSWRRRHLPAARRFWRSKIIAASAVVAYSLSYTGFSLVTESGILPGQVAIAGNEVGWHIRSALEHAGVVGGDETIVYLCADGGWSVLGGGSFFTAERVVSYSLANGIMSVETADFVDIAAVEVKHVGDAASRTVISVRLGASEEICLTVSSAQGGDSLFYQALLALWERHRESPSWVVPR